MSDRSSLGVGVVLCLMLGACSTHPTATQAVVQGTSGGEAAHHGGGHHAAGLPAGPVSEMQVVLRPLAHGNVGPERDARICAQVGALHERVAAIVAAPVPAEAQSHADAWRAGTARLSREGDALLAECGGPTRAFHDLTADL
jgi:hypothetical protein